MQNFHISYIVLIITEISNEKTNPLTIYGILCQNVTIFYRQGLASLFQVQEKLKAYRSFKLNFSSSCFIVDVSHVNIIWLHVVVFVNIIWLHVVVFSEHDILHFWDNFHLFKYYPVKVSQNCFNYFSYSNQTFIKVSKFSFALDK